ncbi:MAG TPA: sigma-70 family RNA polymerase sigma factor [Ktedonobacteraceae bacterium]|nr:sigma-70 family RNA polymerase sigma factor [Ktedonobacteraceae bacterium]
MESPLDIHLSIYQNERELLEALWRDEQTACTCLFKRFSQPLYSLAYRLMKDRDEADDVLQESFIQACRHIKGFEGKSSLGTWLHRITYNAAHMRLRHRELPTVKISTQTDEEGSAFWSTLMDETATPDQAWLITEQYEAVNQALTFLPGTLRSALVLRVIEGLSTKEAAAQLGIEETALKVRLHRARQELRTRLANDEESEARR